MNNQQKIWHSVEIETKPKAEEAVEFALNELDSLGSEINHLGKKKTEKLCIIGYFERKIDDESLQNQLDKALEVYNISSDAIGKIERREIENQDWLAEWKKHWKPTKIGKFIIAPTWEKLEETNKIVIRIDPQMAFGTGTHETTKLCLQALERYFAPHTTFFDVGTGTGILAIAWAKMNAEAKSEKIKGESYIKACDTDEDSIAIARKNAKLNDVENEIDFFVGSISKDSENFDFICANVTTDVIIPLLPMLLDKTENCLILSGILSEQTNLLESELKKNKISKWKTATSGEWISITIDCFDFNSA